MGDGRSTTRCHFPMMMHRQRGPSGGKGGMRQRPRRQRGLGPVGATHPPSSSQRLVTCCSPPSLANASRSKAPSRG